ncbi:MAG: hypothetical protein Q9209_006851 [Squamulea sp. 1 TL-2023]
MYSKVCREAVSFLAPLPNCPSPPAALVMILHTHRALARLSHRSSFPCLVKHGLAALAFNLTRVSTLRQPYAGRWEATDLCRTAFDTSPSHRSYATDAVSRPKAHTGRTTSTSRKKPSAAKTATLSPGTDPATAAQKPAAKKAKPKAKSKPKPRTRAKSTKARKKSAKAKAKPAKKKKKAVKPEEKERLVIKELKAKALTPPKQLAASAFSYREWILSHNPKEIYEANKARRTLKSRLKTPRSWPKLQDERLVTGRRSPYIRFHIQRRRSGDFAGMSIGEAAKLIGAEWRGLSESDKKPYLQESERDSARYDQEVKAVYDRDVKHTAANK